MDENITRLVSDYLDGELTPEATRAFEARLHEDAVQRALTEELAIRDFLHTAGPDAAPETLMQDITRSLTGLPGGDEKTTGATDESSSSTWRTAFSGFGWMRRGPALALNSANPTIYGKTQATQGFGSMAYSAASLQVLLQAASTRESSGGSRQKRRPRGATRRMAGLGLKLFRRKK